VKILAVACALSLAACGGKADEKVDRWPDVERLATPTVPGGDGALLTSAIERVKGDDIPELALEDAIAWRKAGGGLPWRAGRAVDDQRPMTVLRIGRALLDRRADSPDAVLTVLYLGQRLRGEGPSLLDSMMGFGLAKDVVGKGKPPTPEQAALAPTDAEVRRALPADAVMFDAMMRADLKPEEKDPQVQNMVRRAYAKLVIGAPAERGAYLKHVESEVTKMQNDEVLSIVIAPKMHDALKEMFATVDAFAAWK
jgi:hypothetical protein